MPAGLSELGITDYNEEMIFFFFFNLLAIPAMIQDVECRMCLFIKSYSVLKRLTVLILSSIMCSLQKCSFKTQI